MSLRILRAGGNKGAVEKLTQLLNPFPEFDLHFANAFTHPKLVVYTDAAPQEPQLALWGLVPTWSKLLGPGEETLEPDFECAGRNHLREAGVPHCSETKKALPCACGGFTNIIISAKRPTPISFT